jgi:uncharacterized protein YbcV (DUF1398 family)
MDFAVRRSTDWAWDAARAYERSNDTDAHVKNVVREMSGASDEERITFPEVVKALAEAGIERYHADLVAGRKTYYLPDGDFEEVEVHKVGGAALTFSAEGVEKAVHTIQRREIAYREFCRLIADAGRVGYFVSLAGSRAVYYGRTGTSTWNGFQALSYDPPAFFAAICQRTHPHVRSHHAAHPAIRRDDRLL